MLQMGAGHSSWDEGCAMETRDQYASLSEEVTMVETQPLPMTPSQSPSDIEVVVAGHICLDIIPMLTGETLNLAPGRLIEVGPAVLSTGGAVSNTGQALHKLGVNTSLMGKVGDDLFGRAIIQIVEASGAGLTRGMVVVPGEATSYSIILSHPSADRIFLHSPGSNDTFGADDIRYDLLEKVLLFHFGYPPIMAKMYQGKGEELTSIFQHVKEMGLTTSLDLSMPDPTSASGKADWQSILSATLPYVDIFLPSIEEVLMMFRRQQFEKLVARAGKNSVLDFITPDMVSEMGRKLLDMGAKIVGIKLGHRGLFLCTGTSERLEEMGRAQPTSLVNWANRELWAPCFSTQVVGTTGSGDATIAGFLMGFLRGMMPIATLAAACAVGACNVEAADALSGIRSWPETMERIAARWPRLLPEKKGRPALDMMAFKWRWNNTQEVWVGPGDLHY
jgi:sugar/nucleoside kinase (ribokinase family)